MRSYLTYGNTFCAVEHSNETSFCVLQLKKRRKELIISNQENCSTQKTVFHRLTNQKHMVLIVNNKWILTKSTAVSNMTDDRLVKTLFPTIVLRDFYVEVLRTDIRSFVAICRKDVIDDIIQTYAKKGISVLDFSLGNLVIKNLVSFLNSSQVFTSNARIVLENNSITAIEKSEKVAETYQINGLKVQNDQLLALSGIIDYYINLNQKSHTRAQKTFLNRYKKKRFFDLGYKFSLSFLFITLLINFLFFSAYRKDVSELQTQLSINETYKRQLSNLHQVVAKKKKMVESISSASNSKVIWYIDQISKTVPHTLLLQEINYQPLIRPIKEKKPVQFKDHQMEIRGISRNDADFIRWKTNLETFSWIQKISFVNYGKGNAQKTLFDFIIHIKHGE